MGLHRGRGCRPLGADRGREMETRETERERERREENWRKYLGTGSGLFWIGFGPVRAGSKRYPSLA